MGPSWPVEETMTLDSITLGSMHICVSWFRLTRVQLVTAPATRRLPFLSAFTIRSSTAVALNSLMLEACVHSGVSPIDQTQQISLTGCAGLTKVQELMDVTRM